MNQEQDNNATPRMTRPEALASLALLAQKKTTTLEEVVAIQIAVRCISKRIFDRERNFKRRHLAEAANIPPKFFTPPAAIDAIMANPPIGEQADDSKELSH